MSETDDIRDREADQALQALFRLASHREHAPPEDERSIRDAIHSEWYVHTRKRRRSQLTVRWAIAASVVLAVILSARLLYVPEVTEVPRLAATIERQIGELGRSRQGPDVFTGETIVTGADSALALAWSTGGSLRLDKATQIVLISPTEIELLAGRIYFDSLPGSPRTAVPQSLSIKTDAGVVHHLGTQFMTGMYGHTLIVSVREGSVSIIGDRYSGQARVGQRIEIHADGDHRVAAEPGYGADWQWVEAVAPTYRLDGRTVLDFLSWVSRESGRSLRFETQSAEQLAASIVLNGRVDIEPTRALRIFLQTTDLRSEIADNVITIRLAVASN